MVKEFIMGVMSHGLTIKARVRLAKWKMSRNPQTMILTTVSFVVMMAVAAVNADIFPQPEVEQLNTTNKYVRSSLEHMNTLNRISNGQILSLMANVDKINNDKEIIEEIKKIALQSDSLMRLKTLSHDDSMVLINNEKFLKAYTKNK